MGKFKHLMSNEDKDVFIPMVPSVLGAMLMSKVSRQKEGFREDLIAMVEKDLLNLPDSANFDMFKNSYVVANGFMEKWGVNYGHSSIKELDTLQMCLENKSRWFTEILETLQVSKHMSYIEYSLRYNPPRSYYTPVELESNPDLKAKYKEFCDTCFEEYEAINKDFISLFKNRYPDLSEKDVAIKAFENARNVLPLSTHANMGMQSNLRAFCDGLSELMSYEDLNREVVDTAKVMKEEAEKVSVGMVKHADKTEYLVSFVESFYDDMSQEHKVERYEHSDLNVEISEHLIGDVTMLSRFGNLSAMNRHDELPNEFKTMGRWVNMELSEAAHHQFLRHRAFDYRPSMPNVDYGYICPIEIKLGDDEDLEGKIRDKIAAVFEKSCKIYDELVSSGYKYLAPYVVLNCNIRRTRFFANYYALAHFVTLRKEAHSQDEIRTVAEKLHLGFLNDEKLFDGLKFEKRV